MKTKMLAMCLLAAVSANAFADDGRISIKLSTSTGVFSQCSALEVMQYGNHADLIADCTYPIFIPYNSIQKVSSAKPPVNAVIWTVHVYLNQYPEPGLPTSWVGEQCSMVALVVNGPDNDATILQCAYVTALTAEAGE